MHPLLFEKYSKKIICFENAEKKFYNSVRDIGKLASFCEDKPVIWKKASIFVFLFCILNLYYYAGYFAN